MALDTEHLQALEFWLDVPPEQVSTLDMLSLSASLVATMPLELFSQLSALQLTQFAHHHLALLSPLQRSFLASQ